MGTLCQTCRHVDTCMSLDVPLELVSSVMIYADQIGLNGIRVALVHSLSQEQEKIQNVIQHVEAVKSHCLYSSFSLAG